MLLYLAAAASPIEQTPWWSCIKKETVRLERSGERPRDIAIATMQACRAAEQDYAVEQGFGLSLMMKLRTRLEDRVVSNVVEIRTKKKR